EIAGIAAASRLSAGEHSGQRYAVAQKRSTIRSDNLRVAGIAGSGRGAKDLRAVGDHHVGSVNRDIARMAGAPGVGARGDDAAAIEVDELACSYLHRARIPRVLSITKYLPSVRGDNVSRANAQVPCRSRGKCAVSHEASIGYEQSSRIDRHVSAVAGCER